MKHSRITRLAIYIALSGWTFVCLLPVLWIALASIKAPRDIAAGPTYLPFVDFAPSLDAWRFILTDQYENLVMRFVNSVLIASGATFMAVAIGGMAAYGLTRFPPPFARGPPLTAMILATRILPPAVLALPLYFMAQFVGMLDTRTALAFTYTAINLPVALWLLRPVFGPSASEQEEAALLDGASHFRVFIEVAVPMAAAGLAATALVVFILCWNEYLFAAWLASDHAMTVPPWMVGQLSMKEAQASAEDEEVARLAAAVVLMIAPLVFQRAILTR